jgi:hypothetical protein
MAKVYVLILMTWDGCGDHDSTVVGVHSTRASAEAAANVLRTQMTGPGAEADIEEHDLTP